MQAITYWSDGALMTRTLFNSARALALAYSYLILCAAFFGAIVYIAEVSSGSENFETMADACIAAGPRAVAFPMRCSRGRR